jgi:hypothetical protein
MPKERTDPVTDRDGDEHHPAFGVIGVHRIHATPGEVLFQSDLRHPEYIRITVHEATRKRDLKHDWVHPGPMVCEVSVSMSQFASFVSSGGTQGVPCTIDFAGSGTHEPGSRPGLNYVPRLSVTSGEVRSAAAEAYGKIQEAFEEYAESLTDSGKGSAAARRAALSKLRSSIATAAPNVAYATETLDKHAEEVVEKSRADVEAMVARMAEQIGIPSDAIQEIEAGGPVPGDAAT